jgi:hypothetical protein
VSKKLFVCSGFLNKLSVCISIRVCLSLVLRELDKMLVDGSMC